MTVLLTGASGFIGKEFLRIAQQRGIKVRPVYRSQGHLKENSQGVLVSTLDDSVDWIEALQGIDVVVHAAALINIKRRDLCDSLAEYRLVNVQATAHLARQASACGVKRFIFISSIKVNGEATLFGHPFTSDDLPAPADAYALSKAEAEEQLKQISNETGLEVTIIRAPLVYGPGVKGNFESLLNWVSHGLPLPLGSVSNNRRSLVALDNMVDLMLICLSHVNAKNQIFLISDGEDLSTTELLRRIGKAMNRTPRLIRFPVWLISFVAVSLGKKTISDRLIGSLQVDIRKTCELLNWRPSVGVDLGLRKCLR